MFVVLHMRHGRMLPLAKHQGGFGLCIVVARGRTTDEHSGATVPAQRVLQDPSHFAVTVRNVGFLQRDKARKEKRESRDGVKGIKKTEKRGLKSCGTHPELLHQHPHALPFQI